MRPEEAPAELGQTILDTWATVANPFGDQRESDAALMRMRTALEAAHIVSSDILEHQDEWAEGFNAAMSRVREAIETALTADTKGDTR